MARVVGIVQARMGSTRLPGKSLMDVRGKPMLQRVVERLSDARRIDEVIIATTQSPDDQPIMALAERLGFRAVAGSEEDVLSRYVQAARYADADVIMRVTADCPLIDPDLSDETVQLFADANADYAANCIRQTYPRGVETEIFTRDTLEAVDAAATKPYEREHVTPYYYEHPERFKLVFLEAQGELNRIDLRLCVDTPRDLELVRRIYERLGDDEPFGLRDVIRLLDANPSLKAINAEVKQKQLGE